MATPSKTIRYHIRSISLPCRTHPTTQRIHEELNKFKAWEATSTPTAETIYNGLSRLEELYKWMDELLSLPLTQQALPHFQHEEWINELLDESLRILDVCGSAKDIVSQTKEHTRNLQSALRRRKGNLRIESSIAKYTSFRKKIKKGAKRLIAALKQVDSKSVGSQNLDLNHHLTAVIRVLREVNATSISIFQSVLQFVSVSVSVKKAKATKWSLVSKIMHKGSVACEDQQNNANELERLDAAICISGSSESQNMLIAQQRLYALESGIEAIENGLECMFRRLIRARASLLNIVSQ